ncbi:MAG: DUF2971 domain-containing protein [Bacteroidaceae bacterium]|nr:DUF2971 domain-containing protein [Bacteroidaceae bacterium]
MRVGYKYRANLANETGKRRDTDSLIKGELYAPKMKDLNDPFEGSVDLPLSQEQEHWVTPLLQESYSAGVYSMSKQKEGEDFPCNELLWAHYANSHKGFCIEYDLDKLDTCITSIIDYRIDVEYQENKPTISSDDSIEVKIKKAFSTKSLAWAYENEFRLIFSLSGVKKISFDAIRAIYFGLNMPLAERNAIVNGLKDKGIEFYQIERVGKDYKLSASKLLFDYTHEIVNIEKQPTVTNYIIWYQSPNKDKSSIEDFVQKIRKDLGSQSNLTLIDDVKALPIMVNYKPRANMTIEEIEIQAKHWIGYSSFDAPECVWMHPERI